MNLKCSFPLRTDNGPQFVLAKFKNFAKEWQFEHTMSSPLYPESNGKAENSVKTAKNLLRKAQASGEDPWKAVLAFRNTPSQGYSSRPVQRLMNSKNTHLLLPSHRVLLKPAVPSNTEQELHEYQKLLEIEKEIVGEVAQGDKPYLRKSTDRKAQISPLN